MLSLGNFAHASLLTAQCETQLSYGGREMCSATMRCCALSSAALRDGYTYRKAGIRYVCGAPAPGRWGVQRVFREELVHLMVGRLCLV